MASSIRDPRLSIPDAVQFGNAGGSLRYDPSFAAATKHAGVDPAMKAGEFVAL